MNGLRQRWSRVGPFLRYSARYSRSPWNVACGLYAVLVLPQRVRYQPELLKIETTTRCNCACRFCGHTWSVLHASRADGFPEGREATLRLREACGLVGRDMSLETFFHIVSQFPRVTRLDVQGLGEPLLNPAFPSILEWCQKHRVRVQFYTNGTLLSPEMCRTIVDLRVSEIAVSLDGATPGVYEFIRQGADFDRVVGNIKNLVEARRRADARISRIRLAAVVTTHNMAELPGLVVLAKNLGVDAVAGTCFKAIAPSLSDWTCPVDELRRAVVESRTVAQRLGIPFDVEFDIPTDLPSHSRGVSCRRCLWPWLSVNVTIDGFLTPCAYVPRHDIWGLGNVLETPLAQLWNGPAYRRLRQRLVSGEVAGLPCESCRDQV